MTEKNIELPQKSQPDATSASPKSEPPRGSATPRTPPRTKRRSLALMAFLVALIVAVVLAGALWYQQRQFKTYAEQLQQNASHSASEAAQAGQQAQQALAQTQSQQTQIGELSKSLRDAREQVNGLEQAFQLITDSGSELVLLNDIDHLLTIAKQQLQLGGNVANAIISLETAQAQLARANRPGLASLQQTINGDLDRLRSASTLDIGLISSRLETFTNLVGQAPLLIPDDAAPVPVQPEQSSSGQSAKATDDAAQAQAGPWWRRGIDTAGAWASQAWGAVRRDLGNFVDVRRVDDASALLMSPDQATRFRESLRLRVLTAQLALMMNQPGIWKTETSALLQAVEQRFDPKSAQTRQALKLAREFADTPIDIRLPTVENSLQAIETLREARERKEQDATAQPDSATDSQDPPAADDKADQGLSPDHSHQLDPAAGENGAGQGDSSAPSSDSQQQTSTSPNAVQGQNASTSEHGPVSSGSAGSGEQSTLARVSARAVSSNRS